METSGPDKSVHKILFGDVFAHGEGTSQAVNAQELLSSNSVPELPKGWGWRRRMSGSQLAPNEQGAPSDDGL